MDSLFPCVLLFSIIGYFRHIINNSSKDSPKYLINLNKTNESWIKNDKWVSRLTPIFSLFVIFYNFIAWSIYGLTSLFELIRLIILFIWKYVKFIILWIWNEVLHPTLFFVIKLCWHYFIVFSWKLFQFSFSFIIQSYSKSNIIYSFKKLIIFSSCLSIIWIIYSFINSIVVLVIGSIVVLFLFQLLIFQSVSYYRSKNYKKEWIEPNLKLCVLWFIIASVGTLGLFLLHQNANDIVFSGLSVSLSQILFPISLILFFIFIYSFNFLPAYTSDVNGKIKVEDFLKNLIIRLPKLIFSQPFYNLGAAITLSLPLIFSFLLLQSIEIVSKNNSQIWQNNILQLPTNSSQISSNNEKIDDYNDELNKLDSQLINTTTYDEELARINTEISDANKLKNLLIDNNSIFTFEGEAYVGETQRFSVENVMNCTEYKWAIINPDNDKEILSKTFESSNNNTGAYNFFHTWKYPRSYKIVFTPSNNCGKGQQKSRIVYVKKRPEPKLSMDNPTGKESICRGDTVQYTAGTLNFNEYEWEIPKNATFYSGNKSKKITIILGDTPGTVRVRGLKHDAAGNIINQSLWSGTLVKVAPSLGMQHYTVTKIPDEKIVIKSIERPFLFYTLEEADKIITNLNEEFSNVENDKVRYIDNIKVSKEGSKERINSNIDRLNESTASNRSQMLGGIFALFGFALLVSITLSTVWSYGISFNFDLYNFEQPKIHYWKKLIADLKLQNPNQPLLGWFVLFFGGSIYLTVVGFILSIFKIIY